ncbi:MAG: multiheme c-type cytochrome [Candidatus Marinimicrobia bacterium]|jgi:hypothetical protein|nr:multiheme c-type cytochrome [Candidatus Neomarinimicrobiota bacterium]
MPPSIEFKSFPEKDIQFDSNGDIISSDIDVSDFHSSDKCVECHSEHVAEWKRSMHAYSMRDPVFFSGWKSEHSNRTETGERFCIQCHSPVAYVTGTKLDKYINEYETITGLQEDPELSMSIKEGVTCTVCHSFTGISKTVETGYDVAAKAEYHMNPGEGIMYGPIESSVEIDSSENSYAHKSEYNSLFRSSEACLPCHDFKIRGVDAEITFTEWNNIPQFGMAGLVSCQECHMPINGNGYHSHEFAGVDINLTEPIPEDSLQYKSVKKLLQSSVELKFGGSNAEDAINIENGVLVILVTVKSLTGHSLPSGTSFAREAWLETIVRDADGNTIYSSGKIEEPTSDLNFSDPSLVLYSSDLLGEAGDIVTSVTETYDIIPKMLPGLSSQVHKYIIPEDFSEINQLSISVRMRFRAFKPSFLEEEHSDLLARQPVFDMAQIDTTYLIP